RSWVAVGGARAGSPTWIRDYAGTRDRCRPHNPAATILAPRPRVTLMAARVTTGPKPESSWERARAGRSGRAPARVRNTPPSTRHSRLAAVRPPGTPAAP